MGLFFAGTTRNHACCLRTYYHNKARLNCEQIKYIIRVYGKKLLTR